jgi:hypothetical protein
MQQPTPRDGNDWGADNPTVSLGGEGSKATAHPHIEHAGSQRPLINALLFFFRAAQPSKPGPHLAR